MSRDLEDWTGWAAVGWGGASGWATSSRAARAAHCRMADEWARIGASVGAGSADVGAAVACTRRADRGQSGWCSSGCSDGQHATTASRWSTCACYTGRRRSHP